MYHGVGCSYLSEKSFDLQMKFISKHFESYWVSEAISLLDKNPNCSPEKPPIILTFDDGLSNNKITAVPILEKYGLKATFFVCSDLMDGKSMMWNHEMRCRLTLMDSDEARKITNGQCADNNDDTVHDFVEQVKRWPQDKVKELLSALREFRPEPKYTEQMLQDYLIMSNVDMRTLPACIEIGSHTRSHPILDTLNEEEIENQVINSKSDLSKILDRNIDVFCYPNGVTNAFCKKIVSENYSVAVTTEEGFASFSDGYTLLKRIPSAMNLHGMVRRMIKPSA